MSFNFPGAFPSSTPEVVTPPPLPPVPVNAPTKAPVQTPTGLQPQAAMPSGIKNSSAPRNALPSMPSMPSRELLTGMRYGLNVTAKVVGGPVGYLAKIAAGTLGGIASATTVKEAAVGAALGAARAAIGSGTPIGAAIKITQLTMGLITGNVEPRNAMVQGFGAALDLAAGLVPGPVGHAARVASNVLSAVSSVDETANVVAGAARAGERLAGNIAYAASMVASVTSGTLTLNAAVSRFIDTSAYLPAGMPTPEMLDKMNTVASHAQTAESVAKQVADAADKLAALTGQVSVAQKAAAGRIIDTGASTLGAMSDGVSSMQQAAANMLKTTANWFKGDSTPGGADGSKVA